MTVEEYCKQEMLGGYGVAIIERESDRIITPYGGSWSYPEEDAIEQLEVDERSAVTVDGRYSLAIHSGCYEEMYNKQEMVNA